MNKCEHGERITTFCASDCCVWKQAAGCEQCMRKYHNHMGTTIYLTEEDIAGLVKKYTMDNNIKPKCRLLQETIYSYFTLIKTELTNSMDVICKNIINQIGYPYLYSNNTLSTYKRLKNKEYKKLVQKQFKCLYELSMKINEKDLAREESKIYVREMKVIDQFLNNLENMTKNYEQIVKHCQQGFVHDSTLINKINDIIRHMPIESPSKNTHKQKESEHPRVSSPFSIKNKLDNAAKGSKKVERKLGQNPVADNRSPRVVPLSPSTASRPNYSRDVSIDRKLIKEHRFISPLTSKNDKNREDIEKQITPLPHINDKPQPTLNIKELEINEKKKMLIDMMKQKQDSSKYEKEPIKIQKTESLKTEKADSFKMQKAYSLKKQEQSVKTEKDRPQEQFKKKDINSFFKKQEILLESPFKINKDDSKSQAEFKSSDTSNEVQEDENSKSPFIDVQQHAFTTLPLEEPSIIDQQTSETSSIQEQVIVVATPTLHSQLGETSSPLLKKKSTMSKYEEYKLKYLTEKKDVGEEKQKQPSFMIKSNYSQTRQGQMDLKQKQSESIALLLKSVSLNANEAIPLLEAALALADNNISAAQYLTYLYLEVNRPLECLHLCNKMIEKRQKNHAPEQMSLIIDNNKAASLNMMGRYSESIVLLEKCLRIREKDYFYKNLGDAYFSVSIYDKAIYNYEKTLTINESFDEANYNLAVVLYIQQNYYHAKQAITKALQGESFNEDYRQLAFHIDTKINQF